MKKLGLTLLIIVLAQLTVLLLLTLSDPKIREAVPVEALKRVVAKNDSLKKSIYALNDELDRISATLEKYYAQSLADLESRDDTKALNKIKVILANNIKAGNKEETPALPSLDKYFKPATRTVNPEFESALKQMKHRENKFFGTTLLVDESIQTLFDYFYLYILKGKNETPILNLRVVSVDKEQLDIRKYRIETDHQAFEFYPMLLNKEKDRNLIIEESTLPVVDKDALKMIQAVINSNNAAVHYLGKNFQKEMLISLEEKRALKNTLDAYRALGGEFGYK